VVPRSPRTARIEEDGLGGVVFFCERGGPFPRCQQSRARRVRAEMTFGTRGADLLDGDRASRAGAVRLENGVEGGEREGSVRKRKNDSLDFLAFEGM